MVSISDSYKQTNNDNQSGASFSYQTTTDDKKVIVPFDYSEDIEKCKEKIEQRRAEIKEHQLRISLFTTEINHNNGLMMQYKKTGEKEKYNIAYKDYWSGIFSRTSKNNAIMTCLSSIRSWVDNINHYTRMESFNGLIEKNYG